MTTQDSFDPPLLETEPDGSEGEVPLYRAPLQERSRRTLQKLLSAGIRLLESEGPEGLTVGAITRGAGISVGSFYARFQGKDDLLRFLGEGALEGSLDVWAARGERRGGITDAVEQGASEIADALDTLLALFFEGAGRTLALLEGVEDPTPSRRRRFETRVAKEISQRSGLDRLRMEVRVRALVGLLHDAVRRSVFGEGGELEYGFLPEREVLREEGIALLLGRTPEPVPVVPSKVVSVQEIEEADEVEEVEAVGEIEDAAVQKDVTLEEPSTESPEHLAIEPDPFDVWG
jgi:AcrR family transcriptional regulator